MVTWQGWWHKVDVDNMLLVVYAQARFSLEKCIIWNPHPSMGIIAAQLFDAGLHIRYYNESLVCEYLNWGWHMAMKYENHILEEKMEIFLGWMNWLPKKLVHWNHIDQNVWIVPALFWAMWYIKHRRHMPGDKAQEWSLCSASGKTMLSY